MREIKFRVWTGKRMFYQEKQYLASFIRRVVPRIIVDHDENAIYREHESYLPNGRNIDEYLQQYTGLKDKNGKEGYTDDLVSLFPRKSIYRIIWNDLLACFQLKLISGDNYDEEYGRVLAMHLLIFCEIVGNIYENPDLLERKP